MIPQAKNLIKFSIEGPGEIVATDNGDAASLVSFASTEREAFNGLCLVIVKGISGKPGTITVKAVSNGLESGITTINTRN